MRIYEIAKETGVSSADVLEAAKAAGVAASSAISNVNGDEAGKLREALKGADAAAVAAKRQQKMSKAAELNAQFFAEQKAKLEEHLKIAKEAAEGVKPKLEAKVGVGEGKLASPALKLDTPAPTQKPVIRMAPGYKPKPLPTVSAAATGLKASSGFKPLAHAKPVASISISVAAAPKVRPPKPESFDDFERGNRKGKKDREGQKSFDKRVPRIVPTVPQQGGHISVNEESKEISIRGAVIVKDLAAKLNIKPNRLIADLMGLKILASINQRVARRAGHCDEGRGEVRFQGDDRACARQGRGQAGPEGD